MAKKRIYELAKEYAMSGQDLAKKLRDLGFSQVKGHMTALDDFEVLQMQGILEAHGIFTDARNEERAGAENLGGGLILRKKKKKKKSASADDDETVADSAEEDSADEVVAPSAPTAVETPVEADEDESESEVEAEPRPVHGAVPRSAPPSAPRVAPAGDELESHAIRPSAPVDDSEVDEDELPAAASHAPTQREPGGSAPALDVEDDIAADADEFEADVATDRVAEIVPAARAATPAEKPAKPVEKKAKEKDKEKSKPGGKVVGFIDLSKVQSNPVRKSESRRLTSRDDVTPNVQPTMSHDPRRALMRGDRGARDSLSASQLREREANRFRRHARGPAGPGRRGPGGRPGGPASSPHSGGSVKITEPITVKKLAEALSIKVNEIIMRAMRSGLGVLTINNLLDSDTAALLAQERDVELEVTQEIEAEEALIEELKQKRSDVDAKNLESRPPTVAVLGHVDHGKTTLIDSIRRTNITKGEAGGITQHIGAYQVTTSKGHVLTMIDTPGHAAFTAMRARGAKAVDVVILVVSADDGVKPQTVEAINHAKAAKSPIVVAVTKCDKPEANVSKVKQELASIDLLPEEFGGNTGVIEVAALRGQGVEELLERVFLEGELLDLHAHPDGPATGVVLEAEVQQGKGIVAHLLVQDGTLQRGDVILAGSGYGKVRSIHDDRGKIIDSAEPSRPVEVSGLSALPGVGEPFHVVESLSKAKEVAEERERKARATLLAKRGSTAAQDALAMLTGGPSAKHDTINVIIRADKEGSVEVLQSELSQMTHAEISVRVLQAGVGAVTESDVDLAATSNAMVIAFHVGVNDKARQSAERSDVEIRHFDVLYEVIDLLRERMEGGLAPELQEVITGHTLIKRIFRSSKLGNIAGCQVQDGTIGRNDRARLLRDGRVVWTGPIASLRRESEDAREVREGFECGIVLRGYNDVHEDDVIESFKTIEVKRTLD